VAYASFCGAGRAHRRVRDMTVSEAIAIREKEESLCRKCSRYVSGFCATCSHGSNFVQFKSVLEKINDRTIENYR
jgi:hypothetical protein